MAQNIEQELQEEISRLPNAQQRRVLDFARSLSADSQPNGGAGRNLLRHAGAIQEDDLAIIEQVIHQGCETVNPDEW